MNQAEVYKKISGKEEDITDKEFRKIEALLKEATYNGVDIHFSDGSIYCRILKEVM